MITLHFHLLEIKFRAFYVVFSLILTFLISYNNQLELIFILSKPVMQSQQTFVFLDLTEAFYTLLRISTMTTTLVTVPFIMYHIWSFWTPSLYKIERSKIIWSLSFFLCLLLCEILFTCSVLLPKIYDFLISFEIVSETCQSEFHIKPLISMEFTARIEAYVKLIVKMCTLILIYLQLPVLVYFLYSKKVLYVSSLYSNRKFLGLVSVLLSAFLAPPDVLSQIALGVFFFTIFEFLIFIGLFFD